MRRGLPFESWWQPVDCDRLPDPCWVWIGGLSTEGYGKYRSRYAHRVAFEQAYGPIPAGLVIDHLCRNKACVNPAHLEAVTQQVNTQRAYLEDYPDGAPCPRCGSPLKARPDRGHRSRRCRRCDAEAERARYARSKAS